ncbi:hypothetical protein CNO08_05075 [Lysobacter capsici]|nr:hypothetical protein CNO08_05075 [Lysobacter capsici]
MAVADQFEVRWCSGQPEGALAICGAVVTVAGDEVIPFFSMQTKSGPHFALQQGFGETSQNLPPTKTHRYFRRSFFIEHQDVLLTIDIQQFRQLMAPPIAKALCASSHHTHPLSCRERSAGIALDVRGILIPSLT